MREEYAVEKLGERLYMATVVVKGVEFKAISSAPGEAIKLAYNDGLKWHA